MNKKRAIFAICAFGLSLAITVQAAEFVGSSEENSGNVTIGASETHKNLYTAGGMLNVNGNTQGDLAAVGGNLTVLGDVEKDVMLAGGTIIVSGNIGEDARIVGGNITITGPVGGDLVVVGGNLTVSEKAAVGSDAVLAGGNIQINAPVSGSLRIYGGNVEINGKVSGNVYVRASEGLKFGSNAEVLGAVVYKGVKEAVVAEGAKVPTIEFTKMENRSVNKAAGIITVAFFIKLAAWFLAGWVLMRFAKSLVIRTAEEIRQKPWEHAGIGLAALISIPIAAILMLLTVVGYYLAFATFAAYGLMLILANILAAVVLGYLSLYYLTKTSENHPNWQVVLIGVVLWSLIKLIPIVGWIVAAVLFMMVFAALFRSIKNKLLQN